MDAVSRKTLPMCWNPIQIKKYESEALKEVKRLVPCGKCIECVEKRRAEWSFRLRIEQLNCTLSSFLTLTYNDKYLPKTKEGRPTFDKTHLQKYFKRIRKKNPKLKYYLSSEYGAQGGRSHYHAIIFDVPSYPLLEEWRNPANNEPYGFAQVDTVTDGRIHYVTGYMTNKFTDLDEKTGTPKRELPPDQLEEFAMMSKGLGKIYLKHAQKMHKSRMTDVTEITGHPVKLGRYLSEKVFDAAELAYIKAVNSEAYIEAEKKQVTREEMSRRRAKKINVQRKLKLKS